MFFKIKQTTPLRKLMEAYCQQQGLELSSVRFLYDGNRLQGDQKPDDLEMEDEDVIDALLNQVGNGSSCHA